MDLRLVFGTLFFLILSVFPIREVKASDTSLNLECLDSCLAARPKVQAAKEHQLGKMKQQLHFARSANEKLQLLSNIFKVYSTYQFDSALVYVKRGAALAEACRDQKAALQAKIDRIQLLAYGGYYNAAEELIKNINPDTVPDDLRWQYAFSCYWTYVFWSAFTMDSEFSIRMDSLRSHYLNLSIRYTQRGTAMWYYLLGEQTYFLHDHPEKAIAYYKKAIHLSPHPCRLYSQSAFAIARAYNQLHNDKEYGQWLVRSAISDSKACLKECAALQDLAMLLFRQNPNNAGIAHRYLVVAMDDAAFYGNKLRKLEISDRLPPIVTAYQQQLSAQRSILISIIVLAVLLTIGAFCLYLLSRRKNAQLHYNHKLLEHKNSQLNAANAQLSEANTQLSKLNDMLRDANRKREEYLRLFVDICASTMDRITKYRNYVKLKIKANQTKDLLRVVNSDRIATNDMNHFYVQFDEAFLGLYPDFVTEFSKLLKPGTDVSLNKDGSLTTGLRIFAFIRLGVTESSEIATLLSYSPHTIYNYRSAIKGKAIDKAHFEEDVRNLCKPS